MSASYKILFEVKVLHEFYLTDREGKSIFEINSQADRYEFLNSRYLSDFNNIENELSFAVPPDAKQVFKNYKLRLLNSYSGFRVAVDVNEKSLPAGVTGYEPKIKFPAGFSIPVLLVKNSNLIESYTNSRMDRQLKSCYYFSNEDSLSGGRIFPALSADAPDFDGAYPYEQGEIAKLAANDYREFFTDDANNVQWIPCNAKGLANENDRLIVTSGFYYTFPENANVTDSDFILKDSNGVVISESHYKANDPLTVVTFNANILKLRSLPNDEVNDKLLYTLEVTGNNGYSKIHTLVFYNDERTLKNSLGLVMITTAPADPQFNVLDNGGLLITRKQPDGTYNPSYPVFEIRLKSRLAFWRYANNIRRDIQNGLHPDFLINKNGALVTKIPRPLTYTSTLFRKPDNSLYYLPNPEPYNTVRVENNKIYSDIMVPESTLFPIAP